MNTTAHTPETQPFAKNRLLQALILIYAAVWIWAAISPVSRSDWALENILIVVAVGLSAWLCRVRPLSNFSNVLVTLFLILHTVGAHYTYSLVPLGDWIKEAAGLERNPYDRVIHFGFGLLLAYPLRELLMRVHGFARKWTGFMAFLIIATCSGFYELMEWAAAAVVDPDAGTAFLGTQGDPFDSQKDQAMAFAGALITLAVTNLVERSSRRN